MCVPRASSISAASPLMVLPLALAIVKNASQNGSSSETEVRCPRRVRERFFGLAITALVAVQMARCAGLIAFGGRFLRFAQPEPSCVFIGFGARILAFFSFARAVQVNDFAHLGPSMSLGCTTLSKVFSSTNPSLTASSLRVVPFLWAVLATLVALS